MIAFGTQSTITNLYLGNTEVAKAYLGDIQVWPNVTPPTGDEAIRFTSSGNSTVGLSKKGGRDTIEYSTNSGQTWNTMTTATTVSLTDGKCVYVRGTRNNSSSQSGITKFCLTGALTVDGNLNTMIDYQDPYNAVVGEMAFHSMFAVYALGDATENDEDSALKCASGLTLPATTIGDSAYYDMFEGRLAMTKGPSVVSATTIGASAMHGMFMGCESMTEAMPILPCTALTDNCYSQMFLGCESLTVAPILPATNGAYHCYYEMFAYCDSSKCEGHSALSNITCMLDGNPVQTSNYTLYWLTACNPTGTFTKKASANWGTVGASSIPENWTVQNAV